VKVSLKWLKRYIDIKEDVSTLASDLTMFGLNVEGIEEVESTFSGVVFGKVLEVERHPSADKLSVCKVDAGQGEPLNIICGAPNVAPGQGVPVAVHGAKLPGGLKIKKTKIRGVVSEGMICSEVELGIGTESAGIMVLDFEKAPGTPLEDILGGKDIVLDIEVTPNRPDLLCHLGVAREIGAIYRRELKYPEIMDLSPEADFNLKIDDENGCPRYSAAFVEDVRVAPSPKWMQELLIAVGLKPINNIVDVTNFVLMELGQPLHAFDRDKLMGDSIVVRRARKGEKITTLDGVERELDEEILVIADSGRPVALAGVMGGEETEVSEKTKRVLLESATFDRKLIRNTGKRFKLETDASYRFEREGDIGITLKALERACYLIEALGAGRCVKVCRDMLLDKERAGEKVIAVRIKQVNRLMGTHLDGNDIKELLSGLELKVDVSKSKVDVHVPTFRRDLNEEVDIIEEVARTYGYGNIGYDAEKRTNIFAVRSPDEKRNEELCSLLVSRGFAEVITSSFLNPVDLEKFDWQEEDPRKDPLKVANPLNEAQSLLRTSLLPGLLNVARRNGPSEVEGLKIFEIGKVFLPRGKREALPDEELHLTALLTRAAIPLQWIEKEREFDFFDLKGELEVILEFLGIVEDARFERIDEKNYIFGWKLDDEQIIECGLIPFRISRAFDIEDRVFYFDIALDKMRKPAAYSKKYSQIIPYPPAKRDLCLVVDEDVSYEALERVIRQESKHLDSIRLFDYYRGGNLGEGKKSYTVRLSFRSEKGTMESEDVDRIVERLLEALKKRLNARLRME